VALTAAAGLVVGALLATLVPRLLGAARASVPRLFGVIKLTYLRTAAGAVFGLAAAAAIGLSTSDHPHERMTYVVWYGVAVLALVAVIALTILLDRRPSKRPRAAATPPTSGPWMPRLLRIQQEERAKQEREQAERTRERRKAAARNVVQHLELEREHVERREAEQRERIKQELKAEQEAEERARGSFAESLEVFQPARGPFESGFVTKKQRRREIKFGPVAAVRLLPGAHGPDFRPTLVRARDLPTDVDVGGGGVIRVHEFTDDGMLVDELDTLGQGIVIEGYKHFEKSAPTRRTEAVLTVERDEAHGGPVAIDPQVRAWLAHEQERGEEYARAARSEKMHLAGKAGPLMALVRLGIKPADVLGRLTAEASRWSAKIQGQLAADSKLSERAGAFQAQPPAAHPEPTQGDFERLAQYVDARVDALKLLHRQTK
jgi:hypothetical protein